MPDSAYSVGGLFSWKDGRNMPDVQMTTFVYGHVPVSVRLTQATETPEIRSPFKWKRASGAQ